MTLIKVKCFLQIWRSADVLDPWGDHFVLRGLVEVGSGFSQVELTLRVVEPALVRKLRDMPMDHRDPATWFTLKLEAPK